jgi:hypothetical protein
MLIEGHMACSELEKECAMLTWEFFDDAHEAF